MRLLKLPTIPWVTSRSHPCCWLLWCFGKFSCSFLIMLIIYWSCFFLEKNYTASRIILAASGVEHEELLSIAEPLLSDLPRCVPHQEPKSVYNGGDYRHQGDSGVCIIHILYCSIQSSFPGIICQLYSFRMGEHILLLPLNSQVIGVRRKMLWP